MTDGDMGSISWARVVLAFAVVFGLIALLGVVLKYVKMRGFSLPGAPVRDRRMQVIETLPLDPRRRLVIVRRDQAEHLLLLGGNQDIVVEANLDKTAAAISPQRHSGQFSLREAKEN